MKNEPLLSIILPAYNCGNYISFTIESILKQSFTEFILIIVDDGSSDNTFDIINNYDDKRIIKYKRKHHGIISSFNFALDMVNTKYVARADTDDIYFENKFLQQILFLENNKNTVLLGTNAFYMSEKGIVSNIKVNVPRENSKIINNLYSCRRAIIQSTIIARTDIVKNIGGYRTGVYPEDYDFMFRISSFGEVHNLIEPLSAIRIHKSFSHKHLATLIKNHKKLIIEYKNKSKSHINNTIWKSSQPFISIYLNRISLFHYLNGSKIISFLILSVSVLLSPINSSRAIIRKILNN